MGLQCGIVGLPNVGKSTLFNALSNNKAEAANFPFCTIEPNVGVISVPDDRLKILEGLVNPQKVIPTAMEFVDIAGLVKGASKGEGLGNQFLANIREVNAIIHVVRCFDNDNIVHVDGRGVCGCFCATGLAHDPLDFGKRLDRFVLHLHDRERLVNGDRRVGDRHVHDVAFIKRRHELVADSAG